MNMIKSFLNRMMEVIFMYMKKRGAMELTGTIKWLVLGVMAVVISFSIVAAMAPTMIGSVTNTGSAYNGSTIGKSLFGGNNSILVIILIVAIFLGGLALAFGVWKMKSGGK